MKAISSEGKLPFGIGGIKVSVAKIDGKVLTETLYINRQRSSNVYDLINDNGDIYYKVSMCWYDTRGIDIPNTVKPVDAINMVQDNSFMIYVDDGISKGYSTLYMGRIIKLNNGRVVKRDYTTPVNGVIISPKVVALKVGSTQQLSATINPDYANDPTVSYSSSAPTIVEVDAQTGLAIARANGNANVTVTTHDGGFTDVCAFTVTTPVSGVVVSPKTASINVGSTQQLTATISPDDATNKNVTWSSATPDIATVNPTSGLVTSVDNGTTTITVTTDDGAKTAESVIDVTIPVTGINMTPLTATLTSVGATQQLTASVIPDNARRKDISYTTSAEGVATVSPTGLITAVANGTANITATTSDGGFSKVCVVTVNIPVPVASVSVSPTSAKLTSVGATQQLTPTVLPDNATNKAVTYSTSADGVATVSTSGLITAVANGTADITVTTADGAKTAKCAVTVEIPVPVTAIDVTPKDQTLTTLNATKQMAAAITPSNATNKKVIWSSSAPEIAKVDANTGIVTALTNGTANIIATAADGSDVTGQTSVIVNIPVPVSSVSLTPKTTELSLSGTKTVQLVPEVLPAKATNTSVTYSADKPTKVSISDDGLVTALEEGSVIITVTTVDGNKKDTATVTISA